LRASRPFGFSSFIVREAGNVMTDPAFPIKNQVQQLIDIQIDTLRKPSSLTSSELDAHRSRSERIATLYEQLDLIVRERFNARSRTAA